ncbi:zinc finger CCCH domain-containing protein 17-like [Tripterygium wilfordii]|uniref:zinc finger CCCH domain-containing protein 17-like n=1 Tax=Tripterygium wilfordii TaxID=458696 RepID=UPI0018F80C48|nr:zinc finger CCCH domain-containing protein 17-like [Tripterygium wilfordii]
MVASTQAQAPPPSSTTNSASAAPSAEEEALKRNTDCVYFLASPLTCKKGSECEYRHSEYARVNPKDCYFWLNGNCLNPKCGFRHPPLDGLLGTQMAVPAGNSYPPPHTIAAPTAHAQYSAGKQAVPCIFFQGGFCLKGDRCAFLHGPSPSSNKTPQPTPAGEPQSQKKPFGALQKCSQNQKISQANVSKAVGPLADAIAAPKVESALPQNSVTIERKLLPSASMNDEVSRFVKATNVPPVGNENLISRFTNRFHYSHVSDDHTYQNGKDVDELPRESSPGFDVLVDDDHRDSDYFHGEEQYGRARAHEGRDMNSVNEYDMGHSTDYSSIADVDQEAFRDPRAYDSYDRIHGQHAWEQHRTSSERMSMGHPHLERSYSKDESPDHISESDLRYRLSKQRRVNGLRSVVSHEYVPDSHVEEQSYRDSSRRESHRPSHESSISGRLRGRIKLPVRSPIGGSDLHTERETDRGRNRRRLSPGVPQMSSHQGMLRDRMKGKLEEDYNEGYLRGSRTRSGIPDDGTYFSGPRSLAELRAAKNTDNKDYQSLGKRKHLMDHHQSSEGDVSFKGPMPLSEILKRKKQAEAAASGSAASVNKEHDQNDKENSFSSSKNTSVLEMQSGQSVKKEETNNHVVSNKEEDESPEALNNEVADGWSSQVPNASELETEDGMVVDEGMEDHEYEADEQGEGEYDYEQGDEGDYNYDEGENVEGEEEYVEGEEDDGDDFNKKNGVTLS